MGWADTWNDILSGGSTRWKVTNPECHRLALEHFQHHVPGDPSSVSVYCPLAGDDPFVHLLFTKGYSVTTIDLVPSAVECMKQHFTRKNDNHHENLWTQEMDKDRQTVIWRHISGRATLMVGDALQKRPELMRSFDAVYDKDSFGALSVDLRESFCSRIAEYIKPGGVVYLECKLKDNHDQVKHQGPPFSLRQEELMEPTTYGTHFQYLGGLGEVYPVEMSNVRQMGHIMKRLE